MPPSSRSRVLAVAALATLALAGCGGSSAGSPKSTGAKHAPTTIRVPQDAKTISAAVAKAGPGDLVLVGPGTYREMPEVKQPRVTVRGTDRNKVIIDGQILRPNGIVLTGDGDAVQNLTVRNATLNGVLVTGATDKNGNGIGKGSTGYSAGAAGSFKPLSGFLVDHVTSYNNGLYGVYAFDVTNGAIQDSYTSGMADSGLYVGQCKPCNISVHGNVAERNAVGYEGTNASGQIYVYGNRFVGNRVGATTDSDHQEALVPQTGGQMVGNVIAANNGKATPEQADGGFGIGVGIAGGTHNVLARNLIVSNQASGVAITNFDDLPPIGNQVVGNTLRDNGVDVAYYAVAAYAGSGNCVQGNTATTITPATLARACPSTATAVGGTAPSVTAPPGIPFTDVQAPPNLPDMASPTTAPAVDTATVVHTPDLSALPVPGPDLLQTLSTVRW